MTEVAHNLSYNDKQHAYWYDGTRCKGVSTVAKIPDDTYSLDLWNKRMVALGMALDQPLRERALAHHDDKAELNDVAYDALRAAKAHEAAARGTAIHRILERHDLGETIIDTPESRAFRAAYDKALDAAGLTVVPEYVERIIVHPDQFIAGRFDRIFRRRRDGKYVIGDVKSGTNAVKYPQSTAVQLAMYANAPIMAGPLPRSGGKTETFEKLPDKMDLKWGYVIHAPDPEHVEIVKIDIAGGWKIAKQSIFPILDWRKRKDLITEVGKTAVADLVAPASDERVAWIKGRLDLMTMVEDADSVKRMVAERWPSEVATPKRLSADVVWSEADVDALSSMFDGIEKEWSTPFSVRDPAQKAMEAA